MRERLEMDALLAGLRAGGDETRMRLLLLLSQGDINVKELTQLLGQSQPRISRHLKLLTEAGLIDRFREGSWVFYRIAEQGPLSGLARQLVALLDRNDPVVTRDLERLAVLKEERAAHAAAYFASRAADWDRVRALHVDEAEVERAILAALGNGHYRRLLDIGTGTGRILELTHLRYDRAVGLDLSHEMLGVARARLQAAGISNAQMRHGDLYNLPFAPASFDAVTVHQVLHYMDDPARAVAEAARMLAPGGVLLIVDFAPHELEFLRDEHAHRRLGFSRELLARYVNDAGLDLTSFRTLPSPSRDGGKGLVVSLWLAQAPGQAPRRSDAGDLAPRRAEHAEHTEADA